MATACIRPRSKIIDFDRAPGRRSYASAMAWGEKRCSASRSTDRWLPDGHGFDQPIVVVGDKPGHPVSNQLRDTGPAHRQHRRSTRQGFDHDQPEGRRPADGEQECCSLAQEGVLCRAADLANERMRRGAVMVGVLGTALTAVFGTTRSRGQEP